MDRAQVERLTAGLRQAQEGMTAIGAAMATAAPAVASFGRQYAEAVDAELARRRSWREAQRG